MDQFGNRKLPNKPPGFQGFNPYAAGVKHYGAGRSMPNIGPVRGMQGYNERDNKAKARKSAILRRLKGGNSPIKSMSADWRGY
jgi:hypothetical protein